MQRKMEYFNSLKRNCRFTRMNRITNEELRRRMGTEYHIFKYIEEKKLAWDGHVGRICTNRWITKIIDWSRLSRRKRGKPWRDEVDEAMKKRRGYQNSICVYMIHIIQYTMSYIYLIDIYVCGSRNAVVKVLDCLVWGSIPAVNISI